MSGKKNRAKDTVALWGSRRDHTNHSGNITHLFHNRQILYAGIAHDCNTDFDYSPQEPLTNATAVSSCRDNADQIPGGTLVSLSCALLPTAITLGAIVYS